MAAAENLANSITLWTFPIGAWGNPEAIKPLLDTFTRETGVEVRVEFCDYETGDNKVRAVLGTDNTPDIIMEGPERMVATWGASGAMLDLRDMLDDGDLAEIHRSVLSACTAADGAVYLYPLGRTPHCMAINVDAFREANALPYVNLRRHTWTTDQFFQALAALSSHYGDAVGSIYCGGPGGDQGTRALVSNLYDGPFTSPDRTRYTWDDPRIIRALEDLRAAKGIYFDPFMVGSEEIEMFCRGKLKMSFCWNITRHLNPIIPSARPGRTTTGQEIACMVFPSPTGVSRLLPGIWGFGVCRQEDPARIAAAKAFVRFVCDSEHTREAVQLSGNFAARTAVNGAPMLSVWAHNPFVREYNAILPYISENNQLAQGWQGARSAWWTMLQRIGEGGDIRDLVGRYVKEANAAVR